jgi:hypothetical protein
MYPAASANPYQAIKVPNRRTAAGRFPDRPGRPAKNIFAFECGKAARSGSPTMPEMVRISSNLRPIWRQFADTAVSPINRSAAAVNLRPREWMAPQLPRRLKR